MAVHWKMQFMSLRGTDYTVEIYDSSYTGTPVQIKGAGMPFVTREYNDEDMYVPIRTQSGYLRMIVEDANIVAQMQPIKATDRPVLLKSGTSTLWMGFLQPEQYNQPWVATPYEIELPLMSVTEAMQAVEFTQDEGYVSFFSLVRTINSYVPVDIYIVAPTATPIKDVFVQNNNFRTYLTIPERAERSTTDKYECNSVYDALEAFCKYFGFSLHEYGDTFFCVVYPDTGISYYEYEPGGDSREAQWGTVSMDWLTVCSANNRRAFSRMYRRIYGSFETGRAAMDAIFGISEFFKQFSVEGAYPTSSPQNLLFNGNAEIQPYKNGTQKTEWISEGGTDSGGQIIRKPDVRLNSVYRDGASWSDEFLVWSQASKAGTPESALKFNIPRYVYVNANEYAAININASVMPWFDATQGEGFIKKLHCKMRIGSYWLHTIEQSGYAPRYEWSTTESSCFLLVDDNGALTTHGAQYTLSLWPASEMDNFNGFAIDLPSGLTAGYHDIYFELLANAEASADFSTYSSIGYLIHGLDIKIMRGVNSMSQPTPNFETNTISRKTDGRFEDDYEIVCPITTKRGVQYGTGVSLSASHAYISTKYDELGIVRRAAIMNKSREVITVDVIKNTQPNDTVTFHGARYGILSQSIDWRNDTNNLRIINLE